MPVVSITLEDTNRTILLPVYQKIIQDIVKTIKIPYGTLVILHKDIETTLTDSRANAVTDNSNLPSTISKRRIVASVNESYNEDELTTTPVHQLSSYPIFQDQEITTYVYPIYVKTDIDIEFSYISPSKIEATRVRDDIRIRLSQMRNIEIHDIEYTILLPSVIEEFIADVYDLKNRLYPQSLEDYFREHTTKRLYPITDMVDTTNVKLGIHEKQIRIIGLYDFSSMPEKIEVDNENNNYKISFTYKLSIDVPKAIAIKYPVMICNRPLPSKYLSFIEDRRNNPSEESSRDINYTSNALYNLSIFETHRELENRVDIKLPINIPRFDEFHVRMVHKGYGILASILTDVNEDDKRSLFNLREIEPYYIPEVLLEYIANEGRELVTSPYSTFMYFGLHQEDRHFDNSILTIDESLNVSSIVDLDLRRPVRVTIGYILDLDLLNTRALDNLLSNYKLLCLFINEHLFVLSNFKTEYSRVKQKEYTLYNRLVNIINYYNERDNKEAIDCILESIKPYNEVEYNLLTILKNNYSFLYKEVVTEEIESRVSNLDNSSINRRDGHGVNFAMKTVMSTQTIALRRNDLP